MPTFTKQQVCDAMRRAAAKMRENPETITDGVLARNAKGRKVSTLDPNAVCFCALGHLAVELNIDTRETSEIGYRIADSGIFVSGIWVDNDDGIAEGDKLRGADTMLRIANKECPVDADA